MAQPARIVDRIFGVLPDWMFLASGLALLSLALVTPNWLACGELAKQRDLMRLQAERLSDQKARYQEFYDSLAVDDPVLLERLAFTQLGLKPVGKQVLDQPEFQGLDETEAQRRAELVATSASIDKWLLEPLPEPGIDTPAYGHVDSRLVRLTTTVPMRAGMIGAAIACLAAGLWPTKRDVGEDEAAPPTTQAKVKTA